MATVSVSESALGRRLSPTSAEREYNIYSATSEADAYSALIGNAESSVNGLPLNVQECEVEEVVSGSVWRGTAKYGQPSYTQQDANDFELGVDISTVTQHITQSITTVNHYAVGGSYLAPNFFGALNVNEDGTIDGTDIIIPTVALNVGYTFPDGYVDGNYIVALSHIVGRVNASDFNGIAAGAVILTKASGKRRADGKWSIQFTFLISENATNLTVGEITGINKKGWEYLWVFYKTKKQTVSSTNYVTKYPFSAYVEQVYKTADYTGLGITFSLDA